MGGGWNQICDFAGMQGLCVLQEHGVSFEGMQRSRSYVEAVVLATFCPCINRKA